jgi:flagellar motility protein MotE (MotC chaperone)
VDYRTLEQLRKTNPAWRLLVADNAPMIVSFLYKTFIQPNVRTMPQQELSSRLADYLYGLRQRLGEESFPRRADQYLDDWASDNRGWLRKYYPPGNDEAHYDLTPPAERAMDWLAGFNQREFVGAESRLMTVIALLREIAEGTELDPGSRIEELGKRKARIEAEIQSIRAGQLPLLDPTQVKDRFQQMAATARSLLSDFREVEQNFRTLDRAVRERIATWEGGKGTLLEEILLQREAIAGSDQGKSFRAFWDFIMSPARQEELSSLLQVVFALEEVKVLTPDRRLTRIHYDWLQAGEVAQRTVARLSEQLRRYLDDQAWLENRRIMQIIRNIEQSAIAVRGHAPAETFMELDDQAPTIAFIMDRPLFTPPFKLRFAQELVAEGDQSLAADALFEQVYVDKTRLMSQIRWALQTRHQISLADLVEYFPIEQGLAELVAYLSLATEDDAAVIDDRHKQGLSWTDAAGTRRRATMPLVVFNGRPSWNPNSETQGA